MATSAAWKRPIRTACDRCYELKERCVRASSEASGACTRCSRLGLVCSTVRPVRPAGRRPRHRVQSASGTSSSSATVENSALDIGAWLNDVRDLLPEEKELLMFLLGRPENLELYMVSPVFRDAEQQSLAASLRSAFPVLKDAYLACAGTLKLLYRPDIAMEVDKSATLRHASSAMKILRSLPVASSKDAVLCLILGKALALSVYTAVGSGVADICHHCLRITSPFMDSLISCTDAEPWWNFLVMLETMDCMVHRRIPTVRIQLRDLERVDRYLGLCLPLLPYYYDLCVMSHSLANTTDASYLVRIEKQLNDIHAAVEAWQPSHQAHLVNQFQSADIVNLLAQVKVYRLAALLVSHRLRFSFGQQDIQADIWSKEIMTELKLAQWVTKRLMRCVTLPFIVAAIEIRDPSTRVEALQAVEDYVDRFAPLVQKAAKTFLLRVWRERDLHLTSSWFDSTYKPCVLLHYADAA
ncbi:hypothetical protein NA57DRAFT_39941 [Rhizodiscina lignyota]|uniref:Zn(2)-C6 fungal-type domain-containing protein n=1 Tax=Rhizodiscina lignyota TaxID=1504668 RepID=A0A9P4M8H6_9PEZI|nr:hypothetical protein NA57DRAFT_39941 [Rhizodiscina lignyota]